MIVIHEILEYSVKIFSFVVAKYVIIICHKTCNFMGIYSQWLILDYLQVKIGPAVHYCLIAVSSDWGAFSDISKNKN